MPARPARVISSARRGASRPCVISGMTIVPPATTVTPPPSPNASTASAGDPATTTSVASTIGSPPTRPTGKRLLIHDAPATRHRLSLIAHGCNPLRRDRGSRGRPARAVLPASAGALDRAVPLAGDREAAAARRRGRRRQDRAGQGAGPGRGCATDPPAVLRGARRLPRRLRVELRAPDAAHPRRPGGRRRRARAVRPRVPDPPAAAGGDRLRRPGGAADRRDRPRRRRVRGVPARGALGLPDHDPGDRDDPRAPAPGGDPDLEPHPRAARRAQAALPVPLDHAPVAGARAGDRAPARARRARAPGGANSGVRGRPARARPRQGAGRRRDDRLDAGARRARPRGARRDRGRADPGRGAEVLRGLRARARRDDGRSARRGARRERMSEALARHIVTFGRVLREAGLEVGPGRLADALRGLDHVGVTRQEDVYWALRTTLVARREELEPFDRAFDAWFLRRGVTPPRRPREDPRPVRRGARVRRDARPGSADAAGGEPETVGHSAHEVLRTKDFGAMSP